MIQIERDRVQSRVGVHLSNDRVGGAITNIESITAGFTRTRQIARAAARDVRAEIFTFIIIRISPFEESPFAAF